MKLIELTQGKFAQVDDEDYELLSQYKWYAVEDHNTFYALTRITIPKAERVGKTRQKTIIMHRFILRLTNRKILVDHEDHNGLNNQKYNLREATPSENNCNVNSHKDSRSKYVGVDFSKSENRWRSRIKTSEKRIMLGWFKIEEDAARAYDKAAKKYHKEFANLNFKE